MSYAATPYAFDLYYLFVEVVFGNLFLTWLGLMVVFAAIGMFARMSSTSLMWFIILFAAAFAAGAWGEGVAVIVFTLAAIWCLYGALRFYKFFRAYT